jgi:hypothetical protein
LERVEPLEGTNISLFNTIIPSWWAENGLSSSSSWMPGGAALAERVWVANRCQQLNSQQLSSMPLKFHGPEGSEPAWMSNPDPNWYPNGIGDALFSIVDQLYGWGFSCQYITDFYADGFPRTWTVLAVGGVADQGRERRPPVQDRREFLDSRRVVQIDRNPGPGIHGCSALSAYAQVAWGLLAAGNQSMTVSQGGIPQAVLKSERKLTKDQAEAIQTQWMTRRSAVTVRLPCCRLELDFEPLSIQPGRPGAAGDAGVERPCVGDRVRRPRRPVEHVVQGGLTYQNPLALMQMWWLTELRTTAKRIGDAFSAQMLPRGQWISFDASDITTETINSTMTSRPLRKVWERSRRRRRQLRRLSRDPLPLLEEVADERHRPRSRAAHRTGRKAGSS